MAVWCGQCQARNDGDADFCARCGAALSIRSARASQQPPAGKPVDERVAAAVLPKLEPYNPSWLVRLILDQAPDRPDLLALVRRCQVAVRRESIAGGRGRRTYFLADRPGAYFPAPEEACSFTWAGESVTIVIVKDAASPARRAVHYVECQPAVLSVPAEVQRAQYEQLGREKLAMQWQAWLAAMLGLLLGILALHYLTAPPAQVSALLIGATALSVCAALYAYGLRIRLADRHKAMGRLEAAMGLPPFGDARSEALAGRGMPGIAGVFSPANLAESVLLGLSVVLLWLTAREALAPGRVIRTGEVLLILAFAILLYPIVGLLLEARRRLIIRRLLSQAGQANAAGQPYPFEPWLG